MPPEVRFPARWSRDAVRNIFGRLSDVRIGYTISSQIGDPTMLTNRSIETMRRRIAVLVLCVGALSAAAPLAAQERMPPIPPENMTDAQKKAAEELKAAGAPNIGAAPWYVLFRVPELVTLVNTERAQAATRS